MRLTRRARPTEQFLPAPPWRKEWDKLAQYNAERSRGIVHTREWQAHMAKLQQDFDHAHQRWTSRASSASSRSDPRR